MPLPDQAIAQHRQPAEPAQFSGQQAGLVVAALSQSFMMHWYRYQNLRRQGVILQIFIKQSRQDGRQRSDVPVFQLVDRFPHGSLKAKGRANAVDCRQVGAVRTGHAIELGPAATRTERW